MAAAFRLRIDDRALGVVTWPVIWLGAIAWSWIWTATGGEPLVVILLVGGSAIAAVAALEFVIPYRRDWVLRWPIAKVDMMHLVVSSWIVESLPNLFTVALVGFGSTIEGHLPFMLWPRDIGFGFQLSLAWLLASFNGYWWHRAAHHFQLAWRLHVVHHSADRLYWLNATREHVLEAIIITAIGPALLVIIGVPASVMAVLGCLEASFRVLQHSNLNLHWGPMHWIVNHNQQHRWHHSVQPGLADANYGTSLAIWDLLFGTFRRFDGAAPPGGLGTGGTTDFPTTFLAQAAAPFAWTDAYRAPATDTLNCQ
jgi:ornithine lipid hydroxylase